MLIMNNMKTTYLTTALTLFLGACSSSEDAAHLTLGPSNTLIDLNGLQYQSPFVIQVTDVDGNPAPSSAVKVRVRATQFLKGQYVKTDTSSPIDGSLDEWVPVASVICTAEDANNNAILDAGEDINSNGQLEPTNPATVTAHPSLTPTFSGTDGQLVTDSSGFGYFVLTYPKAEGSWVNVKLTASTEVSGSESAVTYEYILPILATDVADINVSPPGGVSSKYGTINSCSNPN
jgi:hypothetical protein